MSLGLDLGAGALKVVGKREGERIFSVATPLLLYRLIKEAKSSSSHAVEIATTRKRCCYAYREKQNLNDIP